MATRAGLTEMPEENVVRVAWSGLLNTDDGAAAGLAKWPTKSAHVIGTFGAGGSVAIEGSNEVTPTNWAPLRDNVGVVIALTAANQIKEIGENTRWVRPRVTAGDGTTSLTCYITGV